MEDLIPLINRLQDAYTTAGLSTVELPSIAVIGSQSSGKSSVLESIIGKDLLPRGSGIVTKRPLILQCRYSEREEYSLFLHKPDRRFYDSKEIRREIEEETKRLLGNSVDVSEEPIHLKLFSKNVVDLTLIDLPGMTRYAVKGQPADISDKIRSLVLKYIEPKNCLILAVSAANTDLANSDALLLAQKVDPQGLRTIGVLTKVDIMDEGTNALEILNNNVVPLQHGWTAVVNRSQNEIDKEKDIASAYEKEKQYFSTHPIYAPMKSRLGISFLREKLKSSLMNHIHSCIPSLRNSIMNELAQVTAELEKFVEDDQQPAQLRLIKHAQRVADSILAVMEGKSDRVESKKLSSTARINYIFCESFDDAMKQLTEAVRLLSDEEIRIIMKNCNHIGTKFSMMHSAVEAIIKKQLCLLVDPSLQCLDLIAAELKTLINSTVKDHVSFPSLALYLEQSLSELLQSFYDPTKNTIQLFIDMQSGQISHPEFHPSSLISLIYTEFHDQKKNAKNSQDDDHQCIKKGFLYKSGKYKSSNLKKRYFKLYHKELLCFPSETSSKPSYVLPIKTAKIQYGERMIKNRTFFVLTLNEQFHIISSSSNELLEWKKLMERIQSDQQSFDSQLIIKSIPIDIQFHHSEDAFEIYAIRRLVYSYFSLVVTTFQDFIPKAIIHSFLMQFKKNVSPHLVVKAASIQEKEMKSFFLLDANTQSLMKTYKEKAAALQQALKGIDSVAK